MGIFSSKPTHHVETNNIPSHGIKSTFLVDNKTGETITDRAKIKELCDKGKVADLKIKNYNL